MLSISQSNSIFTNISLFCKFQEELNTLNFMPKMARRAQSNHPFFGEVMEQFYRPELHYCFINIFCLMSITSSSVCTMVYCVDELEAALFQLAAPLNGNSYMFSRNLKMFCTKKGGGAMVRAKINLMFFTVYQCRNEILLWSASC